MEKHFAETLPSNAENHTRCDWHSADLPRLTSSIAFKRKVDVSFDSSHYTVKSVENWDELIQALSLRREVFHREFCHNFTDMSSEFDELDIPADHLVVIDNISHKIVGNYRLISSQHSRRFYSQGEFFLSEFLQSSGDKLELSRSCVHPEHRCGIVMQLLWRGVIDYMNSIRARYLFGCTSVKSIRNDVIARLTALLDNQNVFTDEYGVEPLSHCRVSPYTELNGDLSGGDSVRSSMPPIMKGYLRAGAKLCRRPAVDLAFQCTDYFTILDREKMEAKYARKYFG